MLLAKLMVTICIKRGKDMKKKNESGLSLIELLLTLTILSIVGVLIWSVFFQGTSYSKKAMTKNQMQQEANVIINNLMKFHRTNDRYEIESLNCKITANGKTTNVFESSQFCFMTNFSGAIIPSKEDVSLTVTIKDKSDISNLIQVDALLFRLKSGEEDEEDYEQ